MLHLDKDILLESPAGSCCHFVRQEGEKWGLKLYETESEAEESWERQAIAARHGLAPEVGELVRVSIDDVIWFGYQTQVARVLDILSDEIYTVEESPEYANLLDGLLKIGLGGDLHLRNIGWIGSKMVGIDFSWHCENTYEEEM